MNNAKLIVLEGLDGSGKSTQIEIIKEYFKEKNLTYAYVHFPIYGHNEASSVIAAYLRGEYGDINKVDPIFVANMYAMDRFLYLPELKKQILENDVVLLDRYVFSNMAYQGAKHNNVSQSKIMRDWINEFEFGFLELPYPDINIFFDVPIETIEKRLLEKRDGNDREYLNGKSDIHEADIEFQRRVRDNYFVLDNYSNFKIVQCGKLEVTPESKEGNIIIYSPEEIFKVYEEKLNEILYYKIKNKIIEKHV